MIDFPIKLDNDGVNLLKLLNELRNTIIPHTIEQRWRHASVATSDATTSFALIQFLFLLVVLGY